MIDLTPLDVRQKTGDFTRGLRGYQPEEVDGFLAMVADRLEEVVRENRSLTERMEDLEERMTEYRTRESALNEALLTAQEMREEVREQVSREADLVRREAEQDAERIRAKAVQDREREQEVVRQIRTRQSQLVKSYRLFLERELAELDTVAEALDVRGRGEDDSEPEFPRPSSPAAGSAFTDPAAVAGAEPAGAAPEVEDLGQEPELGGPASAPPAEPSGLPDWLSEEVAGPAAGEEADGPEVSGPVEGTSRTEPTVGPPGPRGGGEEEAPHPEQEAGEAGMEEEEEPDWLSELLREEP